LENELENARLEYRKMMSEFSDRLKSEARRLGTCVERAKPLFESQRNMRHFQSEVQSLSIQYRKSQNLKETAKSMVKVAEHNMNNCAKKDANENVGEVSKWLEELNECNLNFQVANDTASTLSSSHSKAAAEYKHWEKKTQILEKTSASKYLDQSRSYFNLQLDFWNKLEQKGAQMVRIETSLAEARVQQSQMLANISTLDSRTSSRNDADSKISSKRSEVNIDDIGKLELEHRSVSQEVTPVNSQNGSPKLKYRAPSKNQLEQVDEHREEELFDDLFRPTPLFNDNDKSVNLKAAKQQEDPTTPTSSHRRLASDRTLSGQGPNYAPNVAEILNSIGFSGVGTSIDSGKETMSNLSKFNSSNVYSLTNYGDYGVDASELNSEFANDNGMTKTKSLNDDFDGFEVDF